jgi:BMFP domain-containing protein YqiC
LNEIKEKSAIYLKDELHRNEAAFFSLDGNLYEAMLLVLNELKDVKRRVERLEKSNKKIKGKEPNVSQELLKEPLFFASTKEFTGDPWVQQFEGENTLKSMLKSQEAKIKLFVVDEIEKKLNFFDDLKIAKAKERPSLSFSKPESNRNVQEPLMLYNSEENHKKIKEGIKLKLKKQKKQITAQIDERSSQIYKHLDQVQRESMQLTRGIEMKLEEALENLNKRLMVIENTISFELEGDHCAESQRKNSIQLKVQNDVNHLAQELKVESRNTRKILANMDKDIKILSENLNQTKKDMKEALQIAQEASRESPTPWQKEFEGTVLSYFRGLSEVLEQNEAKTKRKIADLTKKLKESTNHV